MNPGCSKRFFHRKHLKRHEKECQFAVPPGQGDIKLEALGQLVQAEQAHDTSSDMGFAADEAHDTSHDSGQLKEDPPLTEEPPVKEELGDK